MDKATKATEIEFLADSFKRGVLAVCADYHGLSVSEITQLRRDLRKSGANARVVKNTLAKISAKKVLDAAKAKEVEQFLAMFEGPSLVVVSYGDPIAPAKVLADFINDKKKLKLKGAWFEGGFVDGKGAEELSKLPSREQVLAMLLNLLCTPATQLVRIMNEPGSQIARVIEAHRNSLEAKG